MAADVALAGQCSGRWCGGGAAMRAAAERGDQAPHMVRRPRGTWPGSGGPASPYPVPTAVLSSGADPIYIPSAPDVLVNIFVGIWAAIALVSLLRVLPGLRAVYAVRDRCRPFPPDIESRLPLWLEAKACGRRTALMICDEVPGATVLGFHRPCIAIPSSLVEALTLDELDQVILHEHAHVQRRDDWARLAQTLLLSVLWIHPAALFVSRALNREREMACDEWVVARTGLPKAYARCLAHAAEARVRMRGGPTLVPALIGSRHELLRRVDRVLAINGKARRRVSIAGAATAACAMVIDVRAAADRARIRRNCRDCVSDRSGATGAIGAVGATGASGCNRCKGCNGCTRCADQPAPQTREHVRSAHSHPTHLVHPSHLTPHPSHPLHPPHLLHLLHPTCPHGTLRARIQCRMRPLSRLPVNATNGRHSRHPASRSRRRRKKPALASRVSSAAPECRWREASDALQIFCSRSRSLSRRSWLAQARRDRARSAD